MNLLLTCEDVLRFIPDYQELQLSPSMKVRFGLHLRLCPPCRAMLESLQALPQILKRAISEDAEPPTSEARQALDSVMARLQAGGRVTPTAAAGLGPQIERRSAHPMPAFVERALAEGRADRPTRLMAAAYAAIQARGGALAGEPFLPESVLSELPPRAQWKWTDTLLNGCRSAMLLKDSDTGASLHMILMSPGQQFPDHRHLGDEDALLLAGQVEDTQYYGIAGDWFHYESGSEHQKLQGRGSDVCWTLTRLQNPGVRLNGWRGALQSVAGRVS